ncbi:hypothetical protein L5515_000715 [Caenorhabditis briggsae]|uniref:SH2 domain-containing protein n=1 Tax=Caenorhabditis briggsae TaxID=6238 RepID=A0AAE9E2F2_CAEBR|nr:hypothetical protein L5515_000715 [Caenorhabditis briggsae]
MEGDTTKTPYNTIYATLKNKKTDGEVLCCVHGSKCVYNKQHDGKSNENQYVNLGSPKKEEQVASKLTEKLKKLVEIEEKKSETRSKPELMKGEQSNNTVIEQSNNTFKIGEASSAYIGVLTLTEAENRLTNRGEFALYHLSNPDGRLDTLTEKLPLILVYRTTTKKNRHYSIRTTLDQHFFVDCGYPNVRKHYSLNQLVMFYKTSATCEINPDDTSADSFSWWLE